MAIDPLDVEPGSAADAAQTVELARRLNAECVVLDGYQFAGEFQRALKDGGLRLLAVDDYGHAGHYWADFVLNQNLHADEVAYDREAQTRLILGPRHALLRREFWRWRGQARRTAAVARKVLVTLGGADPGNVTSDVVRALRQQSADEMEAVVLVGASSPHGAAVRQAAQGSGHIRVITDAADMSELMAWADVAVAAAGSVSWELAFMGVPALLLVQADNQEPVARCLDREGAAVNLGRAGAGTEQALAEQLSRLLRSAAARQAMSARGPELVDGGGAARVVGALLGAGAVLRRAGADDCRMLWQWANDPSVRAVSFNREPIPWERHVPWFRARLADPHCFFFIAEDRAGNRLGQVRCETAGDEAVLSVSLAREQRGRGYGETVLRLAAGEVFARSGVPAIHAYVKEGNTASAAAFRKAGFTDLGATTVSGQAAGHWILRRASGDCRD
jgi:UDP-2,4-diacetamido-2,4,6-trideoxy-beta-L-altropyranose hydrolase